ncbi:hypothetical protein [Shimia abyssi]|uniref:hypothetical protein n=1 Tax=Shimia abyssi TaxID=1662395 RepID=UPI000D0D2883|nr:hypothetical protein [Shimia abyssi]
MKHTSTLNPVEPIALPVSFLAYHAHPFRMSSISAGKDILKKAILGEVNDIFASTLLSGLARLAACLFINPHIQFVIFAERRISHA